MPSLSTFFCRSIFRRAAVSPFSSKLIEWGRTNFLLDRNFDPGVGYPMLMRELCPPGLAGLMMVTFFAAFMSTISTQMNWGASYLVRDFLIPLFARFAQDEQRLLRASQIISIAVLGEGLLVSWIMVERQVSVDDAWKLLAAMGAGTGLVFMLRWFWWRINAWSEITAMFGSLAWFLVLQRESLQVALCGRAMVTEEQTFCVAVLTVVTWIVATYATRAESEQTLVSFYRLVHPSLLGWKHIAQLAPEVEPELAPGPAPGPAISIFADPSRTGSLGSIR